MTELYDTKWNKQYEKLVEFKRKHGNCLVPRSYQEDVLLGNWVDAQRTAHVKNKLQLGRKVLLDEIGFVWSVANSAQWNKQYEKLVEFKRKQGHCLVPRRYPEDTSLGFWVDTQRQLHSKNTIRLDRKELLNKLGFVWRVDYNYALRNKQVSESKWNKQYGKLVEFKRKNGHCQVPQRYKADPSLATWVDAQRVAHTNNKIKPDRKGLLDELGFVWRVDKSALWNTQYEKLVEFKRKNGHCIVPT